MADLSLDLAAQDPNQLASIVGSLSDNELDEVMRGELRGQVLDEIFRRMAEHFRPEKAKGQNVTVRFVVTGNPAGADDVYEAVVRDGVCTTSKELGDNPRATITLGAVPFLRLVTGAAGGVELFMKGKLKVGGDMMFAAQVAGWFVIPRAG
jgi:putative sterol carrier protein